MDIVTHSTKNKFSKKLIKKVARIIEIKRCGSRSYNSYNISCCGLLDRMRSDSSELRRHHKRDRDIASNHDIENLFGNNALKLYEGVKNFFESAISSFLDRSNVAVGSRDLIMLNLNFLWSKASL